MRERTWRVEKDYKCPCCNLYMDCEPLFQEEVAGNKCVACLKHNCTAEICHFITPDNMATIFKPAYVTTGVQL